MQFTIFFDSQNILMADEEDNLARYYQWGYIQLVSSGKTEEYLESLLYEVIPNADSARPWHELIEKFDFDTQKAKFKLNVTSLRKSPEKVTMLISDTAHKDNTSALTSVNATNIVSSLSSMTSEDKKDNKKFNRLYYGLWMALVSIVPSKLVKLRGETGGFSAAKLWASMSNVARESVCKCILAIHNENILNPRKFPLLCSSSGEILGVETSQIVFNMRGDTSRHHMDLYLKLDSRSSLSSADSGMVKLENQEDIFQRLNQVSCNNPPSFRRGMAVECLIENNCELCAVSGIWEGLEMCNLTPYKKGLKEQTKVAMSLLYAPKYKLYDKIEGLYSQDGRWHYGSITHVLGNQSYEVTYYEGAKESLQSDRLTFARAGAPWHVFEVGKGVTVTGMSCDQREGRIKNARNDSFYDIETQEGETLPKIHVLRLRSKPANAIFNVDPKYPKLKVDVKVLYTVTGAEGIIKIVWRDATYDILVGDSQVRFVQPGHLVAITSSTPSVTYTSIANPSTSYTISIASLSSVPPSLPPPPLSPSSFNTAFIEFDDEDDCNAVAEAASTSSNPQSADFIRRTDASSTSFKGDKSSTSGNKAVVAPKKRAASERAVNAPAVRGQGRSTSSSGDRVVAASKKIATTPPICAEGNNQLVMKTHVNTNTPVADADTTDYSFAEASDQDPDLWKRDITKWFKLNVNKSVHYAQHETFSRLLEFDSGRFDLFALCRRSDFAPLGTIMLMEKGCFPQDKTSLVWLKVGNVDRLKELRGVGLRSDHTLLEVDSRKHMVTGKPSQRISKRPKLFDTDSEDEQKEDQQDHGMELESVVRSGIEFDGNSARNPVEDSESDAYAPGKRKVKRGTFPQVAKRAKIQDSDDEENKEASDDDKREQHLESTTLVLSEDIVLGQSTTKSSQREADKDTKGDTVSQVSASQWNRWTPISLKDLSVEVRAELLLKIDPTVYENDEGQMMCVVEGSREFPFDLT